MLRASQQRGEGNLETAVEFLPRPRQPGLSRDHFEAGPWLRPQPAIMAPFITGPHTRHDSPRHLYASAASAQIL
jgi:hypothetical protein